MKLDFNGHTCHADGCEEPVPEWKLMCQPHWRMVPKRFKDAVWATYRRGQEIDKNPTREYLLAARGAINAVAMKEGRPIDARQEALLLL